MSTQTPNPRPPDSTGTQSQVAAGDQAAGQTLKLVVQRNRALAYTVAGAVTLLDKLMGIGRFDYVLSLAALGLGYLTVLAFVAEERRQRRRGRPRDVEVWWISCDAILITAMIWLTGGVASPWFLWYLACAGAAAAHCSLRVSMVGAGLTSVLYLATLAAMGQIRGLDAGLFHAASNLLFLLGSSLFLLFNTRQLRGSVVLNRQLKRQAVERVEELTRMTRELEEMSSLLQDFTEKDPLTDLHNRRYFTKHIATQAARFASDRRFAEHQRTTGILMLDLDRFKPINDTYGHSAGDQLLKHLAQVLRSCVRSDDRIVRWGGDEFVILVPQTPEEAIGEMAERIVNAVRSQPVELADGARLALSCSVGWSVIDWRAAAGEAELPWESAMAAADQALYLCKAAGGSCNHFLPAARQHSPATQPVADGGAAEKVASPAASHPAHRSAA